MMGQADIVRALQIADQLREGRAIPSTGSLYPTLIEQLVLASFSEGFRRGWWDRDEYEKLQNTEESKQ